MSDAHRHTGATPALPSATYRFVVIGVILWVLAAVTYGTLRLTLGDRPVYIKIRWAPSVDRPTQEGLERTYGLRSGQLTDDRTSSYYLTDLSRENIRALVGNPAIEDTDRIHRTAFRVWRFAPRGPYFGRGATWGPLMEFLTALFLLSGTAWMTLALITVAAPAGVRRRAVSLGSVLLEPTVAAQRILRRVDGWIPAASPQSVALFRIVFGTALLTCVIMRPVSAESAVDPANALSALQRVLIWPFIAAPWVAGLIQPWLLFWGALFIVGAMTRTAFSMITLGALAWSALLTTSVSHHTVSALLVTLVCLLWSRWGDAWSLDAWRRRSPALGTPKEYGYTIWVPGMVLGVTFAAAATAKLRDSGIAWILNGTVKYHFLSDSPQALVSWGTQVGLHPALAVLLSFAAIATESLVIVGVCSRAYRYRLAAGGAAFALLVGFAIFQGLFWPEWWILLLSFLPWQLVRPPNGTASLLPAVDHTGPARSSMRRWMPAILVVVLIAQQIVVSALLLEAAPLISTYGMYSTTYASPAEYETKAESSYWIVAARDHRECRVTRTDADVIVHAVATPDARRSMRDVLKRCFGLSEGSASYWVETRRAAIDWVQWKPTGQVRVRLTEPVSVTP